MTPLGSALSHGYRFRLTISSDGASGRWALNVCGGSLIYIRSARGFTYFRERVTYGKDVCSGGGVDRVKRVNTGIYVHFASAKGDAYDAAGTLRRATR